MKNATATKVKPITTAAPLYGRCISLSIGGAVVEVKVMGDRDVAAAQRELLMSALQAMGVRCVVIDHPAFTDEPSK